MSVETESLVTVTIDGQEVKARPEELIIDAAERNGVYIPRFCYHPRMAPVGMCRMCLVEVSGPRGFSLMPACFFTVQDGQEIRTDSEKARKAQEGVLEFLLVNHPLDCPVCDKGGECPLQDQALSYGPGESRYVEEKRHWAKPIEIGPLVLLDRERCIQCARCTRFSETIAGDAMIDLAFRADSVEVAPFPGVPFTSYFAGNTIQICPVGALTSPSYRFRSRPWDLEQVETTCTSCAVGCRIAAQSSAGQIVRHLGIDSDPVNQSWLCDKGRYGYEAVYARSRFREPLVERGDAFVPTAWHAALDEVALHVRETIERSGPEGVAVIGGARLSNEDAYAWARFAKSVVRTDSVDAQVGDGLPAEVVAGLPHATIDEATSSRVVLTLSGDLHEELPILYLRLKLAAERGLRIVECAPAPTPLSEFATESIGYLPGESSAIVAALLDADAPVPMNADEDALRRARALIGNDGDGVVVVLGRPTLSEPTTTAAHAAALLAAALPKARFLLALRRANTHGAIDMGLAPGLLPGRVALDAGREWFVFAWGSLPERRGRDAQQILRAAVDGEVSTLFLLGADPLSDFPDRGLARAALEQCRLVVFVGTHANPSSQLAHVVLPIAGDAERGGTTTSLEGRVTRLAAKVVPPGVAWPAWSVAEELARRLGEAFGYESVDAISDEIAAFAPAYRGVDAAVLGAINRRDGAVVPIDASAVEIARRVPRPIDPTATPGILSTESQGAPLSTGRALPLGWEPPGTKDGERPAALPATVVFPDGNVDGASAPPRPRNGALRLLIRRALFDRGSLSEASPSFTRLVPQPVFSVHPDVLARLGVEKGSAVRVVSQAGPIVATIGADPALASDVGALTANVQAPGEPFATALVDATLAAVDVTVETA
jgi:NADH-quinone oxidoreductase subunit G